MTIVYRNFYRDFYRQTNGFLPLQPLDHKVYPGDFFQIRNGVLVLLGNIFSSGIVDHEKAEFGPGMAPQQSWHFSDGVSKPYSGRGIGLNAIDGEFEFSKLILAFDGPGSYMFKANQPESVRILNWSELQNELLIKLTQTYFSFREVYLVTETARALDWTLAISGVNKAELEIATSVENYGLTDIFGNEGTKTIQAKDIEYYERDSSRHPVFLKAKKLVVQHERLEILVEELVSQRVFRNQWVGKLYESGHALVSPQHRLPVSGQADPGVLDFIPGSQLNPNTALSYFKWTDMNLDDVEKLFETHGS